MFSNQRFLTVYSGVLTAVFAITVLTGFDDASARKPIEELTVQRINVVEPDGTLRMVISNRARMPGIYVKGKEHLRGYRQTAGTIFLNDEGTENGGLTFSGAKDASGTERSSGHLGMDRYMQDQMMSIGVSQTNDQISTFLRVLDQPSWPISEYIELVERIANLPPEQQQIEIDKFLATHPQGANRIFLGRSTDRAAQLQLKDTAGRDRIVLRVDANGVPRLQFLDENGNVVSQLPQ